MFKKKENDAPKQTVGERVKAKVNRAQKMFLISNVLMTLIFAANSVINMIQGWGAGPIQYVTIALLAAYIIAFVVLIVLFNKDNKNLKENMTNYKFAIKFMKKFVNIINLALAVSVMVESITLDSGAKQIFSFIAALLGIIMAVFKLIMTIVKFIKKKKKAARKAAEKQAKAERRAAMTTKVKKMIGTNSASEEVAADTTDEETK